MKKSIIACCFMLWCASDSAVAQDTRAAELVTEDKKLNVVFKKISGKMSVAEREKLVKAQRAWLSFRDLDCKWAFRNDQYDCLVDRTANRAKELESSIFTDADGKYVLVDD